MSRLPQTKPPVAVTPEAAAVWVAVEDLRPWDQNPRLNDPAVAKVAESIKRFGFGAPLLARRDGELIAGHTRLKAALKLGLDRVPVRYLDLDPADARLLALADNKLAEIAEWDDALLAEILKEFDPADAAIAGFDPADLDIVAPSPDQTIPERYEILIVCADESTQAHLLERFAAEGLTCRALLY